MQKDRVNFLIISISLLCSIILLSCGKKNYPGETNYSFKSTSGLPDYKELNYWASHPWKKDAADNIPSDIKNKKIDSIADVFFIHPTIYTDVKMPMGWNANIDDEATNKKTDNSSILYQTSVFNEHCRVFAPRYRQANFKAFYTNEKDSAKKAFDIAYEDVKTAFEYYLKTYNNNRPIIIASHSQGTLHAGRLLKEFFEGKELKKKLVCAYIIGLPVFTSYFQILKPCVDSTSTGCFVTWRTFQENYVPEFVQKEKEKAFVTNPLTWRLTEDFASARLNKGGILKNFNKVITELVHAQVHDNILWVNKPKFFGNIFLTLKNYHIVDYNLFYMNIRENVQTRIISYFKNNF
jgi:hypothetical protein